MAYTTINKSTDYFNTKLWSGNGSSQALTGVGHQTDMVWIKSRTDTRKHNLYDAVRGVQKRLVPNDTAAEDTVPGVTAFGTDGFTVGSETDTNGSSRNFAGWSWSAGGTAPSQTYVVKVVSDSGNKYRFDDFGTSAVTLDLQEGGTYTFDQADSSNSGHPLRFYTAADKTGGEYTTGVTTNGTPGSSGAYTRITVAASAPTLYYQCSSHAGMGGQANTNSLFGSSNFSGSIQSTVSANTTAGFSISTYTGTGSSATIGHGLGASPDVVIIKKTSAAEDWNFQTSAIGYGNYLVLNSNSASASAGGGLVSAVSSTTVTVDSNSYVNSSGATYVMYCFAEKTGYSKFGSYVGNGNADGAFIYTGFKPALFLMKETTDSGTNWIMYDNKRSTFNAVDDYLKPNSSDAESTGLDFDFLSNGIKCRNNNSGINASGQNYIFMAFGQSLVGSNNIPATAR